MRTGDRGRWSGTGWCDVDACNIYETRVSKSLQSSSSLNFSHLINYKFLVVINSLLKHGTFQSQNYHDLHRENK